MDEFKPDYRDMQSPDYVYKGKSLNQANRGRAISSRNYRHRNEEKLQNYEEKHPLFRLRLPADLMAALSKRSAEEHIKPQVAVRRLIKAYVSCP